MHERDALPVLTPEQVAAATDPAAAVALLATLGAPKRTSYSALAAYDACPYRYVLRFLLRIPGPPVAAFSFGSAAHGAFQRFTAARREAATAGTPMPGRADLDRFLEEAWATVTFPDPASEAQYRERVAPLMDAFWRMESAQPASAIAEERWFNLRLEPADGSAPVVVGGSIDRIDRLPSGAVEVIDYKTGRIESQESVDTNLQLSIYALACRDATGFGRPEKVTLWFAEHGERRSTARTDAELDGARATILDRVAAIRRGELLATPSEATCRWCDAREYCPSAIR